MTIVVFGDLDVKTNMETLTVAIRDKLLKRAMKQVTGRIAAVARQRVPVDLGTLESAIDSKIFSKGGRGSYVRGLVGIRSRIKRPIGFITRGRKRGQLRYAVPTRYAHFAEFGTSHSKPQPFMRPAWDEAGGEPALYTFLDVLQDGIKSETLRTS